MTENVTTCQYAIINMVYFMVIQLLSESLQNKQERFRIRILELGVGGHWSEMRQKIPKMKICMYPNECDVMQQLEKYLATMTSLLLKCYCLPSTA